MNHLRRVQVRETDVTLVLDLVDVAPMRDRHARTHMHVRVDLYMPGAQPRSLRSADLAETRLAIRVA